MLALIILAVILLGGYIWYASIISRRNTVLEALGSIDAQLTQRHDLIPNILTIAQSFMTHERELMEAVTAQRAAAQQGIGARDVQSVAQHMQAETLLAGSMGRLFALAENYPQLKSNETMVEAQRSYRNVEDNIAAARRFYNSAVTSLNNAVQIFPGSFFAGIAGVGAYPYFEASEAQRAPVNAQDYLKQ